MQPERPRGSDSRADLLVLEQTLAADAQHARPGPHADRRRDRIQDTVGQLVPDGQLLAAGSAGPSSSAIRGETFHDHCVKSLT